MAEFAGGFVAGIIVTLLAIVVVCLWALNEAPAGIDEAFDYGTDPRTSGGSAL